MKTRKRLVILTLVLGQMAGLSAQSLPYQNPSLSAKERAADLCSRLTLEEKAQLMLDESPAIPRMGIKKFFWWSEALHGAANQGNVTVFPEPIGMAASFNPDLLYQVFDVASTEFRAQYNKRMLGGGEDEKFHSLSVWTPNVNIFRDPRWGRGQETYGEDPYLTSVMGTQVVRGLQGPETSKYRKLWACAKHYAVHSGPEYTRHTANVSDVSLRDLWETYLPAFKTLVQDAKVREVMCAYQRLDDQPCCGNARLLQQILRDEWGFQYLVVSDCGAVSDFWQNHKTSSDAVHAAAVGTLAGTDVECGWGYVYRSIPEAVRRGLITEQEVDKHVCRLLEGRFDLGEMDDPSLVEWSRIPYSAMSTQESAQKALEMARQTIVLLQNKNNVLPLRKNGGKIAVIGPNADNEKMMWGNYNGTPNHTVTILSGIRAKQKKVIHLPACPHTEQAEAPVDTEAILAQLRGIQTVVFVGGISPALEGEEMPVNIEGFRGGDRTSIELPAVQRRLLRALKDAGKTVIFVNCSGSALALTPETESCDAILQAWYAGQEGGTAVADVLFGDVCPSGKLPVTFYRADSQLPDYENYSMRGRTYRYFDDPLFAFGYGLSYTTFDVGDATLSATRLSLSNLQGTLTVPLRNTGRRSGDEVVQLYVRDLSDAEGPLRSLRGFQRVTVKAGATVQVTLPLTAKTFELFDPKSGTMRPHAGRYELLYGTSSRPEDLKRLEVTIE